MQPNLNPHVFAIALSAVYTTPFVL